MSRLHQQAENKRLPAVLHFLQECPFVDQFIEQAKIDDSASYSKTRQLNLMPDGTPQYCLLSKTPPTSAWTGGHTTPGGYTPSGKWKGPKQVPGKMDKRVGK
jgi:hypothetical protein